MCATKTPKRGLMRNLPCNKFEMLGLLSLMQITYIESLISVFFQIVLSHSKAEGKPSIVGKIETRESNVLVE